MTSGEDIVEFGVDIVKNIVQCKDIDIPAIFVTDIGRRAQQGSFFKRAIKKAKERKSFTIVHIYYYVKSKVLGRKCNWTFEPKIICANLKNYFTGDIHYVNDLYSNETMNLIKLYNPDLCFHNGHVIIKKPLLSVAKNGIIGYHHGDLTKYRGGLPCFWELFNNEKKVGVTLQILNSQLDMGRIIMQKFIKIERFDTLKSLQKKVHYNTTDMGYESIKLMLNPNFEPKVPDRFGVYNKYPTFCQWVKFQILMFKKRIFSN